MCDDLGMKKILFLGHQCVSLENAALKILVTQSVGPRIISLRLGKSENLFAELSNSKLANPDEGDYSLYGGHRLWHAPEIPRRTYIPDDDPVEIIPMDGGLRISQVVEKSTGLQKSLEIILPDDSSTVIVDHHLTNFGLWPVKCAPWAITQLKPGGRAILPQPTSYVDEAGVLPNRSLALWPYTDIGSPHIAWGNHYSFIMADLPSEAEKLKVGYPNPRGWMAYSWHDMLFVKYASYDPTQKYADHESSSQCFCGPDFIELETLGPVSVIDPGETITHREIWRLFSGIGKVNSEDDAQHLVDALDLEVSR